MMARILEALHLRTYDPATRAERLRRADELFEIARALRNSRVIEADHDGQDFMRRRHHGRD